MMKDNMKKILVLLILFLAVGAATLLVGKSQEVRRGAYFDQSEVVLLGSGDIDLSEEGLVQVKAVGLQEGTKVTSFDISLMVDGPVTVGNEDIVMEGIFTSVITRDVELVDGLYRVWLTAFAVASEEDTPGADASGVLPLFTFKLHPTGEGAVKVYVDPERFPDLGGWNPDTESVDMDITVGEVEEYTFNVIGGPMATVTGVLPTVTGVLPTVTGVLPTNTPIPGNWPVLNFLVRFTGINENTEHNEKALVKVTAVGPLGESVNYENIEVTRTESESDVYRGSVVLSDFSETQNAYVLIKGPRHLQSKYCKNSQTVVCDAPGGSLDLSEYDPETATVYNFVGWPLLAGDLPDEDMFQDEVVDVSDYTRLVNSFPMDKRNDPDLVERNDINGNGVVEVLDMDALLKTLSRKYGALY